MISGGIVINKDEGLTSFQVLNRVIKLCGVSKGGHLGTLDAHATGVLVIMLGSATKLIPYLPVKAKKYVATFKLGVTSNTYDAWGDIKYHGYKYDVTKELILSIISKFTEKIEQVPPMFSAKKIKGIRLYKLAHAGIDLPRKPQSIDIFSFELDWYEQGKGEGSFKLECSRGTYVRSLISDIGVSVGCGAIMTSLVRVADQGFDISDSHTILQIEKQINFGGYQNYIVPLNHFVSDLPEICIDSLQSDHLSHGKPIIIQDCMARSGFVRISINDSLIGIGKFASSTGQLLPERIL